MADDTDVLLMFCGQTKEESRHIEKQRATLTNLIIVIASAALGLIVRQGLTERSNIPLAVLLMWLGLFGTAATIKFYERYKFLQTRLDHWYIRIEELRPNAQYLQTRRTADEEHQRSRPWIFKLHVHWLWLALHGLIALFGGSILAVILIKTLTWQAIAALGGVITALVTILGVWLVVHQIKDGRRAMKTQFISKLETEIASLNDIYAKLLPGETWSSPEIGPKGREEISKIVPYLGFFAKIKFLIDEKAIDLATIDGMFAFRFFLVVNNRHVQQWILFSDVYEDYWSEIFALHSKWIQHRRKHNLKIPFEETSIELYDSVRYSSLARGRA